MKGTNTNILCEEIGALCARASGQTAERYFATAATGQIVDELRRVADGNSDVSPPLALLMRLDDQRLAFVIAAMRDGGETAAVGQAPDEAQAAIADALAESYMTNHKQSVMLRAATRYLSGALKRLERGGVALESDPAAREALALLANYQLYQDDPDNPDTTEFVEDLAGRMEPAALAEG